MGLEGVPALVKGWRGMTRQQQRSVRSYAGVSAGSGPRLAAAAAMVGTRAASSSAEPSLAVASSSSGSAEAEAAAAGGSSCTDLMEVPAGCTDLREVQPTSSWLRALLSEPSAWFGAGMPGHSRLASYQQDIALVQQALSNEGLQMLVCFEGERSGAKVLRGKGSGSGADRLRGEGPLRQAALEKAGIPTTEAQLEADWWQGHFLATGQAVGVLDRSHRNWDSDNLIITGIVNLTTGRDVFYGSWELEEDGKVDIKLWDAVDWAMALTAEGGCGLKTKDDVLLFFQALCLLKSDWGRFAQAGIGSDTISPRLRTLLTEFGPNRYFKGEYADATPFERVMALAQHLRTTPFLSGRGGRRGNFAGSVGEAVASYVALHCPIRGSDGQLTTALPTGLEPDVLLPVLERLLTAGSSFQERLAAAAAKARERTAQLIEEAKAALLKGGEAAVVAFPPAAQLLRQAAEAAAENVATVAAFSTGRSLPSPQTAAIGLLMEAAGMGRKAAAVGVCVPADNAAAYNAAGLQLVRAATTFSPALALAVAEQRGLQQVFSSPASSLEAALVQARWGLGKLYSHHPEARQLLLQACDTAKAQLPDVPTFIALGTLAASVLATTASVTQESAAKECHAHHGATCLNSKRHGSWLPLLYSEAAADAVEAARKAAGRPTCRVHTVEQLLEKARSRLKEDWPFLAAYVDAAFDAAQQQAADAAVQRPGQGTGDGELGCNCKLEFLVSLFLWLVASVLPVEAETLVGNCVAGHGTLQGAPGRWPWLAAAFQRSEEATQLMQAARQEAGSQAKVADWANEVELVAAVRRQLELRMPSLLPFVEPCLAAAKVEAASGRVQQHKRTQSSTLAACLAAMALAQVDSPAEAAVGKDWCKKVQTAFGAAYDTTQAALKNPKNTWLLGGFKPKKDPRCREAAEDHLKERAPKRKSKAEAERKGKGKKQPKL